MPPQITCLIGGKITLAAFVLLFSAVGFQVCPQTAYKRMQSHTGYICLIFLHCVFSNAPSNCLPEKMHSLIGCICLIFRHCVFSDVSTNHLHVKMHNYTDCICSTCLQCGFSNGSTNCLHEKIYTHIGCTCLTFHFGQFLSLS